jgi:hypothetical protein
LFLVGYGVLSSAVYHRDAVGIYLGMCSHISPQRQFFKLAGGQSAVGNITTIYRDPNDILFGNKQ